jgi:chemotaxis protein CheD
MPARAPMIDVFLMPGDYFVGTERHRIRTLLGSCVSITLWHPDRRIGAMSHFLVTERGQRADAGLNGRYGEDAMILMLTELRARGIDPAACQAKVFGGGIMFPDLERRGHDGVGRKNGEAAERLLAQHKIPIVSESRFGIGHRHIIFNVRTGDVWVRAGEPGDGAVVLSKERT